MEYNIRSLMESIKRENINIDEDEFEITNENNKEIRDIASKRWDVQKEDGLRSFSEEDLKKYKNIIMDEAAKLAKSTIIEIKRQIPEESDLEEFFYSLGKVAKIIENISKGLAIAIKTNNGIVYVDSEKVLSENAREKFGNISYDAIDESWEEIELIENEANSLYEKNIREGLSKILS